MIRRRHALDEHRVRSLLGYALRADHPWSRLRRPELSLNEPRPRAVEAEGPRREQEFEGAAEFRG